MPAITPMKNNVIKPEALPPAIFLMGPTASGKTDIAVQLVQELPLEIISVDSALVYRGMDVGSAKPGTEVLAKAPHHLIDIRDPSEPYSAADFRRDALALMNDITGRGKVPLLVGGTMLYFKALRDGLSALPEADPQIRAAIEAQAKAEGWPAVHAELEKVDPQSAAVLHPNHSQRIERALEVFRITGVQMSQLMAQQQAEVLPYRLLQLALLPEPREVLHHCIAWRFHKMMQQGFIEEVQALYARGDLHENLPSIRAVGYRQAWDYLSGSINREAMIERAIIATRQLAKRQFTWLRGWPDLESVAVDLTAALPDPLASAKSVGASRVTGKDLASSSTVPAEVQQDVIHKAVAQAQEMIAGKIRHFLGQ